MASRQTIARLEVLIWVLIYGGLFGVVLGIATRPTAPATGWSLMVVGAVVAAVGVFLIWLRSRLDATP
jgi:hypothetical protein